MKLLCYKQGHNKDYRKKGKTAKFYALRFAMFEFKTI